MKKQIVYPGLPDFFCKHLFHLWKREEYQLHFPGDGGLKKPIAMTCTRYVCRICAARAEGRAKRFSP